MLKYEVQQSEKQAEFVVSAIDSQNGGEIYLALFSGPRAKKDERTNTLRGRTARSTCLRSRLSVAH